LEESSHWRSGECPQDIDPVSVEIAPPTSPGRTKAGLRRIVPSLVFDARGVCPHQRQVTPIVPQFGLFTIVEPRLLAVLPGLRILAMVRNCTSVRNRPPFTNHGIDANVVAFREIGMAECAGEGDVKTPWRDCLVVGARIRIQI